MSAARVSSSASRSGLPINVLQADDPAELAHIVGDQRGVMGERNGGNGQVVGADGRALPGEVCANLSALVSGSAVKGQTGKLLHKLAYLDEIVLHTSAAAQEGDAGVGIQQIRHSRGSRVS